MILSREKIKKLKKRNISGVASLNGHSWRPKASLKVQSCRLWEENTRASSILKRGFPASKRRALPSLEHRGASIGVMFYRKLPS